ncbi:hypothetical protein GE09DRAFT_1230422 [Coniochaeta sp. 2T2.1]|nr:hypothetical protein GE09DRAFT_1230422 [Coniochaeta sp. 2T2.1]
MASVHSFCSNQAELGSVSSTTRITAPRYPGLDDGDLERLRILLLFTRRVLSQVSNRSGRIEKSIRRYRKRMRAVIREFDRRFYGRE